MFKAIGSVILLVFLSQLFASSFSALDSAVTATFNTVETAAQTANTQLLLLE